MLNIALETREQQWVDRRTLTVENVCQYLVDNINRFKNPEIKKYDLEGRVVWRIKTEDNWLNEFIYVSDNTTNSFLDFIDLYELEHEDEYVALKKWIKYLFDN